ncbi:unnamed protein product, partial [Schistosoma guineensis]
MVIGQRTLSILCRHLFINTCRCLVMVVVVLRIPLRTIKLTVLTFVLKIVTLILVDSCFEFHIYLNCRNAVLALLILSFTSASDRPCSSMMLTKYVKDSTCSRVPPSGVIGLVSSILYL